MIREKVGINAQILDVGCSSGFLGSLLNGWDGKKVGIEMNKEAAKKATAYYDEVRTQDIRNYVPPSEEKYDVIVLADIIEHLDNPEDIVRKYIQNSGGERIIIISVPNVANIYIRLNLLFGRFDYGRRGLLDRTHLRFFTKKSIKEFCENLGLHVERIEVTPIPLPLINRLFAKGQLFYFLYIFLAIKTRIFKGLLSYQFILLCRVRSKYFEIFFERIGI